MVVRINTGKSIRGVLRYNELKREHGQAKLIASKGFLPGVELLKLGQLANRLENRLALNTRTRTNTLHISLNFSPNEKIDTTKMEAVAHAYLRGIGFGNQPYLIYQHFDSGHPHVHLVTINIDENGKRIETHNLGKNQSEKVRKELEISYSLVKAEGQDMVMADLRRLGKINYGEVPSKPAINAVVTHVLHNYSFSSIHEYNAILKCFRVTGYRGEENSQRFLRGGLAYHFLDEKGIRQGVPLKASSLRIGATIKALERRFTSQNLRKDKYTQEVKGKILTVISELKNEKSELIDFQTKLKKQGIDTHLVYTATGFLYGVSYIDHRLGLIYKGSELSKELGASGLRSRFSSLTQNPNITKVPVKVESSAPSSDLSKPNEHEENLSLEADPIDIGDLSDSPFSGPNPKKKKKKKKSELD